MANTPQRMANPPGKGASARNWTRTSTAKQNEDWDSNTSEHVYIFHYTIFLPKISYEHLFLPALVAILNNITILYASLNKHHLTYLFRTSFNRVIKSVCKLLLHGMYTNNGSIQELLEILPIRKMNWQNINMVQIK